MNSDPIIAIQKPGQVDSNNSSAKNLQSPFISSHRVPLNNENTSVVCILFDKTFSEVALFFFNPRVPLKAADNSFVIHLINQYIQWKA